MNYLDQAKLTTLNNLVVSNLENILDDLGVKFRHSGNTLVCTCPIHGGDNRSAFNIYLDGEDIGGYWLCFTHGCHTQFKRNAIGLIQGILSHQNENWCESGDRRFPFNKTIEFLLKELNVTWEKLDSNPEAFEKAKFITSTRRLNKRVEQGKLQGISREKVRASLKIPSPYFIKRGFSPEILDEFDIGDCVKTGRPMSGRAVCPVYDNSGRVMVGCVGRSLYEKCEKCSLYHPIDFPCSTALSNQHLYSKWKNSDDLNPSCNFYGWWQAKKYIEETKTAILVEGQGDALKLHQAGFKNTVGMFGSNLSDEQAVILESSGAMNLIVLTDNDDAGCLCREKIKDVCGRLYRLYFPEFSGKDIGDMNINEVKKLLENI